MWFQKEISLRAKSRGFHLITVEITEKLLEIENFKTGILHLFIRHTSASLTLNENADPDVRSDMESHMNKMIPEQSPWFKHTCEGADDMPAHIKCSIIGASLTIPITNGKLNLGTWQGIYLCEHRNNGGARTIVVTISGEERG